MDEMSNIERQLILKLDSRFDDFGERLAKVEGKFESKPEKTFYEKLGVRGGIIALIISIFTGGFTIYEKSFVNPQKELKRERLQVRNTLDEILQVQARISFERTRNTAAADSMEDSLSSRFDR